MNMTTHASLTESSVSDAIHAHDRKGREGKGIGREGNGGAGSPSTTSSSNSTRERFWRSVTVTSGCWTWTGHINPKGYGRFWDGRRLVMAHRFSYEMVNNIPPGLEVGHLCHVRNCVNPEHLSAMTHADNVQMGLTRRGRTSALTGAERSRRYREKLSAERAAAANETGWWV